MNLSSRKRIISGFISYALALVGLIAAVYVLTVVPVPIFSMILSHIFQGIISWRYGYAQFCGTWIDPPILRNDRFFITTDAVFLSELKLPESNPPEELD